MSDTAEIARLFKALSDHNRLQILQLLRECCPSGCELPAAGEGNTVSRLAEQFDLSLSTVSHHLKELRTAGLIVCQKRGQTVYCAPNSHVLAKLEAYLESLTDPATVPSSDDQHSNTEKENLK
jgi:DNA-binding transcriptional ArsR family regulator